jgi:hypothetical protein
MSSSSSTYSSLSLDILLLIMLSDPFSLTHVVRHAARYG